MAGDGRGARAAGSAGTLRAGGASSQIGRTRARAGLRTGCCAAGGLLAPRPGWERCGVGMEAGRAERGPDVSAGGFVRPQPGPSGAARKLAASSGPQRLPRGAEAAKDPLGLLRGLGFRHVVPEANCYRWNRLCDFSLHPLRR